MRKGLKRKGLAIFSKKEKTKRIAEKEKFHASPIAEERENVLRPVIIRAAVGQLIEGPIQVLNMPHLRRGES